MTWQITPASVRLQAGVGFATTIGKVRQVNIARGEAEPGSIKVEVYDVTLDVTTSSTLRTGKPVRFQVDNGAGGWKTICEGKVTDPIVDYDPRPGASVPVNVKVDTADLLSTLQNTPESRGVGTIEQLRRLLTAAGIPYVINGTSTADPAAPDVIATNDNASLWDQILVTRDSVLGYAWVDMDNKLRAYDSASMPAGSVAALTPAVYSDIDIDWSPDQLINTVNVMWRRYDIGSETSADVPYGPYIDAPSRAEWGERSATFTAQGALEDEVAIAAYGQEILDRNATAEVRPRTVTIPIREAADLAYVRNIDINSRVTVTYPDGVTTKVMRVVGIDHTITPWDPNRSDALRWLMVLTLALPLGVAFPSQTPGTGVPYVPPDSIGNDELEPGSVDLDNLSFEVTDAFGITTYAQTAPPAIPPAKAGDLWIDLDDNNRLYRCNGAAWVDVRDLTIQDALETADLALVSADGKSTIHHSTGTPGSTPNRAGDTWFQYASNIVIGQWRGNGGTSWTAETIGNQVIANLDAAKITTGFLDANRIAAGSIGTSHLAAGSVVAGTIAAGAITAAKIAVGALDGKVIKTSTSTTYVGMDTNAGEFGHAFLLASGIGAKPAQITPLTTAGEQGVVINSGSILASGLTMQAGIRLWNVSNTERHMLLSGNVEIASGTSSGDLDAAGTVSGQHVATTGGDTTAAAANAHVSLSGLLSRSTSTRRNKKNIKPLAVDVEQLLALEPHTYRSKLKGDDDSVLVGFIAEEAEDLGLTEWVGYDEDGKPESFSYPAWTAALQAIVRHQADQIQDLTARLAALEEASRA